MTDVRCNDLAKVETIDGREIKGIIQDVREEVPGHERVVIRVHGEDRELDTAADRVEVAR